MIGIIRRHTKKLHSKLYQKKPQGTTNIISKAKPHLENHQRQNQVFVLGVPIPLKGQSDLQKRIFCDKKFNSQYKHILDQKYKQNDNGRLTFGLTYLLELSRLKKEFNSKKRKESFANVVMYLIKIGIILQKLNKSMSRDEKCESLNNLQEEINNIFSTIKSLNNTASGVISKYSEELTNFIDTLSKEEDYSRIINTCTRLTIFSLRLFLMFYFNVPCIDLMGTLIFTADLNAENQAIQEIFFASLYKIKENIPEEWTEHVTTGVVGISILANVIKNDPQLQEALANIFDNVKQFFPEQLQSINLNEVIDTILEIKEEEKY